MNIITPPAVAADVEQERINKAVDAASTPRYLIAAMWSAYLFGIVAYASGSILGWIISRGCIVAALGLWLVSGSLLIGWRIRYRGLVTKDIDYLRAKKNWVKTFWSWIPMLLLIVIPFVLYVFFPSNR